MSSHMPDPHIENIRQVLYNRNKYEYQYFPEEYFSGADITIYFGDLWIDEITSLSFVLREPVMPVYGYASYTWDDIARGSRIVEGEFRIAFKEAGYLFVVLDHISMLKEKAKPRLAYLMGGEEVPNWIAGVKENIEDTLMRYHGDPNAKEPDQEVWEDFLDEFEWPDNLKLGDTDATKPNLKGRKRQGKNNSQYLGSISQLQDRLIQLGYHWPEVKFNWQRNKLKVPLSVEAWKAAGSPKEFYLIRRYDNNNHIIAPRGQAAYYDRSNPDEADLQRRLDDYPGLLEGKWMGGKGGRYDGKYGKRVTEGVQLFQQLAGINDGSQGRWVSLKTKTELEKGLKVTGVFDTPTKVAVMLFQRNNGLPMTGIVDPVTRKKLSPMGKRKKIIPGKSLYNPDRLAEPRFAQYEKEVWGRASSPDKAHRRRTFFYYGQYGADYLQKNGFDIYITYGPYPEHVIRHKGQAATQIVGSPVNFNTTVKAIRNVQLISVEQIIDASGNPIEEVYRFIAQDLD